MNSSFLKILRKRDFSRLWTAQILSQLVSNMLTFALILHIYDLTGSSTTISLVMIASAVPSALFGPFSGVITDRVSYKKVLIYTNILRFLVALLFIPASHNTLAILEIIFLISAIAQFFSPAEMSSIPLIVEREEIVAANSIYIATLYGSLIIGYGIAGPLLGFIGSNWLFVVVALSYLISAFAINSMSDFDRKEPSHNLTVFNLANSINSVWSATKEGISYIKNKEDVFDPMIKSAIGWAMLGAFIVILPAFALHTIGISTKMTGLVLIAPAGVGMFLASFLLNKYKDWAKNRIITTGFVICGITLLALALFNLYAFLHFSIIISVVLMIILGMSAAFVYISTQSLLHLNSEGKMRGRVFGISAMMINLAMGIPALFIGGIADLTSPTFTLIILALIIMIYSATLLFDEE